MTLCCAWCDKEFDGGDGKQDGWFCCSQSCAYTISGTNYELSAYSQRIKLRLRQMVAGEAWWRGSLTPDDRAGIVIPYILDDPDMEVPCS